MLHKAYEYPELLNYIFFPSHAGPGLQVTRRNSALRSARTGIVLIDIDFFSNAAHRHLLELYSYAYRIIHTFGFDHFVIYIISTSLSLLLLKQAMVSWSINWSPNLPGNHMLRIQNFFLNIIKGSKLFGKN